MKNRASVGADLRRTSVLLVLALVNASCAEVLRQPQVWTTLERSDDRRSGACDLFGQLDRRGLAGITYAYPREVFGVLAGFWTVFSPGRPPFACDRLDQAISQGAFRFHVHGIPGVTAENYVGAFLEVQGVPEDIRVVFGEPWDLGQGWLSSTTPRESCRFRLSVAAGWWDPAVWGGPTVGVIPLRSHPGLFDVPGSMRTFIVTDEVGRWLRSEEPETGFVITPASSAINSKSDSTCIAWFIVRLRVFVRG